MPIYEYTCDKCGKKLETIQKMSDKPLKTHAGCGGKLTKLISAAGFQFKGTGWYVTDYARKSKPETAEGKKEEKTESSASKETSGNGASDKAAAPAKDASEKPAKSSASEKRKKS
jgi:putative FmdB family regulatory protein